MLRSITLVAVASAATLWLGSIAPAKARMVALPNVPARAVQAPVIVVGKITGLEKDFVTAEQFPNSKQDTAYQIATLKVEDGLRGANGVTHIRLGFVPTPKAAPVPQIIDPNVPRIAIRPRPNFQVPIEEGLEGCFFLAKHHKGDFYVVVPMFLPLVKKDERYAKDLAIVKQALETLADPVKALKSKDADARRQAASILVTSYRQVQNIAVEDGKAKTELLPAEVSKLLLNAIVEADWTKFDRNEGMQPQGMFQSLGLTPADGWTPPEPMPQQNYAMQMHEAAKKWVADHPDYRVSKFVSK